jgi:protoporphyrinogen oxidase
MNDCVIVGGGLAGMAAAWQTSRQGLKVTLIERDNHLGGLASSFEMDGRVFPLGYHHILSGDDHLLAFLGRLGLLPSVHWTDVDMAFSIDGSLHTLSGPADLLRFPISLVDRFRLGALIASAWLPEGQNDIGADAWVRRIAGARLARDFFDPLTNIKFGMPCAELSAAWLRTRLRARESGGRYGYIPGADWVRLLIDALRDRLVAQGVDIRLKHTVTGLVANARGDRIEGVTVDTGETIEGRECIATLAPPIFMRLVPDYPDPVMSRIQYTGVVSTVLTTAQDLPLPHYWTNFLRPAYSFGGIFRLDRLNPTLAHPGDRIVNFCTHVRERGPGSMLTRPPEEVEQRYLTDFEARFGITLQPSWTHTSQIPYYSPVFVRGFENPAECSRVYKNLRFAGNFRTFPVLATTGSAMGSGWSAGMAVCRAVGARPTPLSDVEAA